MIILKKESILEKCTFSFVMTIITSIIGFYFYWLSKGDEFLVSLIISLIGYLPAIVFLVITLIRYYKADSQKVKRASKSITVLLTAGLLYYYIFAIFICAFIEVDNPVTNINNYKSKLNDSSLLKVFPKDIPANVEKVDFIYAPGILQGSTKVALYYVDKNMTKEKFDRKYKKKAIWIGYLGEYTEKRGLLSSAFTKTPASSKNESDYIIYLVEAECDESGYCNHGSFNFAAFNEKTNEVIYKFEEW